MAFNISDFNADIAKSSIAHTSHFEGWILGGPGSYNPGAGVAANVLRNSGLTDGMRFRIESLNMPGRTLTTLDQNYHGPTRAIPYRFSQQPVSMSIILSKDMREREVFMRWQDFFMGNSRNNINQQAVFAPFDTRYYHDGIGTIKILQYSYTNGPNSSNEFELQTEILLNEAYPLTVNDIAMSWGDEGYAKLQVEIRYRYSIELNKRWGATATAAQQQEKQRKDMAQIIKDNPIYGAAP
jgi:hypothetical protein